MLEIKGVRRASEQMMRISNLIEGDIIDELPNMVVEKLALGDDERKINSVILDKGVEGFKIRANMPFEPHSKRISRLVNALISALLSLTRGRM